MGRKAKNVTQKEVVAEEVASKEVAEEVVAAEELAEEEADEKVLSVEDLVEEVMAAPKRTSGNVLLTEERIRVLEEVKKVLMNLLRISNIVQMRRDIKHYIAIIDGMIVEALEE